MGGVECPNAVVAKHWWDNDPLFVHYDTIKGIKMITELVVFAKGLRPYMSCLRQVSILEHVGEASQVLVTCGC